MFPPKDEVSVQGEPVKPLRSGDHVVIVGGGIAGSALARRLLMLMEKEDLDIRITIINTISCNYCGGLITNLALRTFNDVYKLRIPKDVVLTRIKDLAYINRAGTINIDIDYTMLGVLRTSRFNVLGFDDAFKQMITRGLSDKVEKALTIIEPAKVIDIISGEQLNKKWKICYEELNSLGESIKKEMEADFLAIAGGLKMLNQPVLKKFMQLTGYQPPPLMPASVTEIDTSNAKVNIMDDKLYIVDGIIPGAVLGLVSKGKNWLTLTSLGKKITKNELDIIFKHPVVKEHLDLPEISGHLRCKCICKANVYIGAAENFYGDNWAIIGDLNGLGRVLKDGYLASLLSGKLVAETLIYIGKDRHSLHDNYYKAIKRIRNDNHVGIGLFKLNTILSRSSFFNRFLIRSANIEKEKHQNSGPLIVALRALMTGDLPYKWITVLFIQGILKRILTPWKFLNKHKLRTNRN